MSTVAASSSVISDPRQRATHRDLLRRWVALVSDPDRRLDEAAHLRMSSSFSNHIRQVRSDV